MGDRQIVIRAVAEAEQKLYNNQSGLIQCLLMLDLNLYESRFFLTDKSHINN